MQRQEETNQDLSLNSFALLQGLDFDAPQNNAVSNQAVANTTTAGSKSAGPYIAVEHHFESERWVYGGAGNDTIWLRSDDDSLRGYNAASGGDGDDVLKAGDEIGRDGFVVLSGDEGNDFISFDANWSGVAYGGDGDDHISSAYVNAELFGGAGDDELFGGYGDSILHGGTGNDILIGWMGNDTFIYEQGDGDDVIQESRYLLMLPHQTDRVMFGNTIHGADILIGKDSDNRIVFGFDAHDQDFLRVAAILPNNYPVAEYQLTDGSGQTLSQNELSLLLDHMGSYAQAHGLDLTNMDQIEANADLRGMIALAWSS